jgi:hypothetical protein
MRCVIAANRRARAMHSDLRLIDGLPLAVPFGYIARVDNLTADY